MVTTRYAPHAVLSLLNETGIELMIRGSLDDNHTLLTLASAGLGTCGSPVLVWVGIIEWVALLSRCHSVVSGRADHHDHSHRSWLALRQRVKRTPVCQAPTLARRDSPNAIVEQWPINAIPPATKRLIAHDLPAECRGDSRRSHRGYGAASTSSTHRASTEGSMSACVAGQFAPGSSCARRHCCTARL